MNRFAFAKALHDRLVSADISVSSATLGRDDDGRLWLLIIRVGDGPLRSVHARLRSNQQAETDETISDVAQRLVSLIASECPAEL